MKQIFSICFFTFAVSMLMFCWSKFISKIERNDWMESSMTKYELFLSHLKQSGKPSGLYHFSIVNLRDGSSQTDFRSETL